MLMVCPNCHSDHIIEVQGQHFCINCGQAVPNPTTPKPKTSGAVAVQENGLPEGVTILPVNGPAPGPSVTAAPKPVPSAATAPEPTPASPPLNANLPAAEGLVKSRVRLRPSTDTAEANQENPAGTAEKPAKRKPGRPKAGRLDVPRSIGMSAPAALPSAPKLTPTPAEALLLPAEPPKAPQPPASLAGNGLKLMSDIAPRRTAHHAAPHHKHEHDDQPTKSQAKFAKAAKQSKPSKDKTRPHLSLKLPTFKRHHVHKIGVPPLHYGAILAFSLRARVRPRLLALSALASLAMAGVVGYGTWLLLASGLGTLAGRLLQHHNQVVVELGLLAALYYIGRSIGQAAIIFGVAREADQRPVSLTRQIGIGINTFGRRLSLDLGFSVAELLLAGLATALVIIGGEAWPMDLDIQVAALFTAFLLILYLLTALALSRGLAGVVLTLTPQGPFQAAGLGWRLFSHRLELLGLRFLAAALELVLAVPLALLAAAFIASAPSGFHVVVAVAVGGLAWVAGALFGTGTATWWAALYRQLVLTDHAEGAVGLLSSRQPQAPNRAALSFIVSLTSFLIAAILAVPWLKL